MFWFKDTKNKLCHKCFPGYLHRQLVMFYDCRSFKNTYFTELLATGFYWPPGFSNKINATHYSVVESYSILNENIMKSKVKFKINRASINGYNYGKLRLSLKLSSL